MKNKKRFLIQILVIWLLSGCATQATGSIIGTGLTSQKPLPTETTASTLALPEPTITLTPTITPTIGPPPDMELKDVTIYPETFERWEQDYFMLGRVRNNSDQIMVFRDHDTIFNFTIETWEHQNDKFFPGFLHYKYLFSLKLGGPESRKMNCILYPGDEGVIYFKFYNLNKAAYIFEENMDKYDGPLGIWYTYESFYNTKPDLPLYYHPKTENLEFVKENGEITFDYDMVDIPNLLDPAHESFTNTWLILYNTDGKILNVLNKWMGTIPGFSHHGGTFHVHGTTGGNPSDRERYFDSAVPLTSEMIERVDHIEVLNEFQEELTCRGSSTDVNHQNGE